MLLPGWVSASSIPFHSKVSSRPNYYKSKGVTTAHCRPSQAPIIDVSLWMLDRVKSDAALTENVKSFGEYIFTRSKLPFVVTGECVANRVPTVVNLLRAFFPGAQLPAHLQAASSKSPNPTPHSVHHDFQRHEQQNQRHSSQGLFAFPCSFRATTSSNLRPTPSHRTVPHPAPCTHPPIFRFHIFAIPQKSYAKQGGEKF